MEAMNDFLVNVGANPGRSGHRLSVEAGRIVYRARENVARLFNLEDPLRVVFCSNATAALNLGIRGILGKGDHVITGSMEHNSVMRPLQDVGREGVKTTVVQCDAEGFLDAEKINEAIRPDTRLIVLNHGSNIVGSLAPVRKVGIIARDANVLFMIDSAQTAGCVPVDMERDNIDMVAFTGHKALMGPQGTGGLVIGSGVDAGRIERMGSGGTGSRSESDVHPDFLPDKYESGTLNTVGLAGLAAGIGYVLDRGVEHIHEKNTGLVRRFIRGAAGVEGLKLHGCSEGRDRTATVSFTMDDLSPSELGLILDDEYDIMSRVGLHCAPNAHRTIGTFPQGTVRFGMGYFNRPEEVDAAIEALGGLAVEGR